MSELLFFGIIAVVDRVLDPDPHKKLKGTGSGSQSICKWQAKMVQNMSLFENLFKVLIWVFIWKLGSGSASKWKVSYGSASMWCGSATLVVDCSHTCRFPRTYCLHPEFQTFKLNSKPLKRDFDHRIAKKNFETKKSRWKSMLLKPNNTF
jgi:hypothetical protein